MDLAQWLKLKGKTQAWLAKRLEVDHFSVSRYVTGRRRPEWDVLVKLADVTGGAVTADDFLDRKRPAAPAPRARKTSKKARSDPERRAAVS